MNPLVSSAATLLGSISNDRSAKCNASQLSKVTNWKRGEMMTEVSYLYV